VKKRTKAERQVELVYHSLQRMARGSNELIARAARKLLRQMLETTSKGQERDHG